MYNKQIITSDREREREEESESKINIFIIYREKRVKFN